jgi:hypothetical protein
MKAPGRGEVLHDEDREDALQRPVSEAPRRADLVHLEPQRTLGDARLGQGRA